MILGIRTDKPEAELYVADEVVAEQLAWQAHRELSNTIFYKLDEILDSAGIGFKDLKGIVVFKGPGSFTGLRIGVTVANTLSYALNIPVVGSTGEEWLSEGLKLLKANQNHKVVVPTYGGEANITKPRK